MRLKLNISGEAYKEFRGKNVEQMPTLIADGRVPMSVAGLMQRRLDVRNVFDSLKRTWMSNYFNTGDAVVYHPDGRVKIVLDSQHLRDMTPESPRNDGALVLTSEQYDAMDGEEFKKGKLGKTGWMSKKDVKSHPIWKALARDQFLLEDYADLIFSEGKKSFGYDNEMAVFTTSTNRRTWSLAKIFHTDTPEMRAWYVGGLINVSSAIGRIDLDRDMDRLVGVAPETQEIKSLEGRL